MSKSYSELMSLRTFKERFEYLNLSGQAFEETFGAYRYLNQNFYRSPEWRRFRRDIIIRDEGCDLGIPDRPIYGKVLIHHINPITKYDILHSEYLVMDPENVICVSHITHEAIHYGDFDLIPKDYSPRKANDTIPWR